MLLNLFNSKKTLRADFAIIDSVFPQKKPFAFRNSEINEYLERIENCVSIAMAPTESDIRENGYSLGITREDFIENKDGYLAYYPKNAKIIRYQNDYSSYKIGLAYSFFLAETYLLLSFYEKHEIPFTFVLYPGGQFGINDKRSDEMLKKLLSSKQFRAVIVTQKITEEYLLEKKLCNPGQIEFIYGGFVQFKKDEVLQRQYYSKDKQVLDICFVGAKYSEKGIDKGYDVFIDFAKKFASQHENVQFHVVGGFNENEINIEDIRSRIKFYGYLTPEELKYFYTKIDILLSPNRPSCLFEGNFDGFPIGIDAGYCGVALFVADELSMNTMYRENGELVIVKPEINDIVEKIEKYYQNPESLIKLAQNGQLKTQKLFDIDYQIDERIKVFEKYAHIKVKKRKEL